MIIRSFIALQLSKMSCYQLAELADPYQAQDKHHEISWPDVENYHITLAFLGNQTTDDLQRLGEQLGFALQLDSEFSVMAVELSYFPYHSRPNVLAVMLKLNALLEHLKNNVDQVLRRCDIAYDKHKFVPHVTLGRVRGRKPPRLTIPPRYIDLELTCTDLTLFRSELRNDGAIYRPLYNISSDPASTENNNGLSDLDDRWD